MCNVNSIWGHIPPYEWGGDEVAAVKQFSDFSRDLSICLTQGKTAKQCILEILKWGGINNQKLSSQYSQCLSKALKKLNREPLDINNARLINDIAGLARKNNDWRISSWSKILPAWKPGEFFIYDSRVAIGLAVVTCRLDWFMPPPRSKNIIFDYFYKKQVNHSHANAAESYLQYLQVLQTLAADFPDDLITGDIRTSYENAGITNDSQIKKAHIEKLLFMIPKMLTFHIGVKWTKNNVPQPIFKEVDVSNQD